MIRSFSPVGKVPGYLDVALKALALHTEARTSLTTYACPLLPILLHQISSGENLDDLGLWEPAATHATTEDGTTFWAQVVGVGLACAFDRSLFRVLEWGGMEVK